MVILMMMMNEDVKLLIGLSSDQLSVINDAAWRRRDELEEQT